MNSRRLWVETIGKDAIKGDDIGDNMWRWQSLIEYAGPDVANAGRISDRATWVGIETVTPGHEHTSMGVIGDQLRANGDAYATGQFEYLWDRADNDFSGGEEYQFEDPSNDGVPKQENIAGDHGKAVDSVAWLRDNHQIDSYYVPAHIERQGAFVPGDNRGYNVEHLRDFNNAGLFDASDLSAGSVAFGGEFAPGHQFQSDRGSYSPSRPTAGFGTYGGAGAYGAAEVSVPGFDFDGNPVTQETIDALNAEFEENYGGNPYSRFFGDLGGSRPPERIVLGRPSINTMWDALLGEGRRYFIFFSSDWHGRGAFGPFEQSSTGDAWPGEYQKVYAYARGGDGGYNYRTVREVVSGMRAGNSFSVMGDLIDDLSFVMCQGGTCATMGETLTVDPEGEPVIYRIRLRDPEGINHSPYAFNNASLLQMGMEVPTNEPQLDNIDIIRGDITGPIAPTEAAYTTNVANASTEIFQTVMRDGFTTDGEYMTVSGQIPAASIGNDMYFRMRGTNMPKGTPNETDIDGNPLLDLSSNNIPCPFPYVDPDPDTALTEFNPDVCPAYLPVNDRLSGSPQIIDFDVEAWTDLWFYANPIFVEVARTPTEG